MYALKNLHTAAVATAVGDSLELINVTGDVYTGVAFQIEGINGDTVTFQGSIDGTTYYSMSCMPIGSATPATSATADGIWHIVNTSLRYARASLTRVSGTVTVTVLAVDV